MIQVSKKFIGSILIILCLAIVLSLKLSAVSNIRILLVQVCKPVLQLAHRSVSTGKNIHAAFVFNTELKRDNAALKNQVLFLQSKINQLQEYEIENRRLRSLLEFKENVQYDTIPAKVIGRDLTGWVQVILIDKGSRHGVQIDMPVVSGDGIAGKVIEAGYLSSKIQLLIDKQSRIGAIMQQSRIVGLIEGTGKTSLIMNYLPRDEDFFINDLILSSGLGQVYEKGLVIGRIRAIYEEKFGLYKYAEVIPAVKYNKLEEVLVILNTKQDIE